MLLAVRNAPPQLLYQPAPTPVGGSAVGPWSVVLIRGRELHSVVLKECIRHVSSSATGRQVESEQGSLFRVDLEGAVLDGIPTIGRVEQLDPQSEDKEHDSSSVSLWLSRFKLLTSMIYHFLEAYIIWPLAQL